MNKGFTLIELLITISIILLMAVVAIPAFNQYSAKANLNAKAEEIKYFIETAYAEAQSPQRGSNGAVINITTDAISTKITKSNVLFKDICFTNIADTGCNVRNETDINSIDLGDYNIMFNNGPLKQLSEIRFLASNGHTPKTAFCSLNYDGNTACYTDTSDSWFSINANSSIPSKSIKIYREPFKVEVY